MTTAGGVKAGHELFLVSQVKAFFDFGLHVTSSFMNVMFSCHVTLYRFMFDI